MKTLPSHLVAYKMTPEFTEASVPPDLLKSHNTKAGVWGKIIVLEGILEYRILQPDFEVVTLGVDKHGVVEPTVPHEVEPKGPVRFCAEFYR